MKPERFRLRPKTRSGKHTQLGLFWNFGQIPTDALQPLLTQTFTLYEEKRESTDARPLPAVVVLREVFVKDHPLLQEVCVILHNVSRVSDSRAREGRENPPVWHSTNYTSYWCKVDSMVGINIR